jgi:hypothetical protein
MNKQMDGQADKLANGQMDDGQMDRHTDKWTKGHIKGQTDKLAMNI